jgi:hypothetical protein
VPKYEVRVWKSVQSSAKFIVKAEDADQASDVAYELAERQAHKFKVEETEIDTDDICVVND